MIKKCPKCLTKDSARYCPICGTEMFYEDRFGSESTKMKTVVINGTKVSLKYIAVHPATKSIKTRLLFFISKVMHATVLKNEDPPSTDNQHWIDHTSSTPKN